VHEKSVKEWEDRLTTITTFTVAESFWQVHNNMRPASDMTNETGDIYLFRDSIKPEWEDSMNAGGGRWILMPDISKVDETWTRISLCLIGQTCQELSEFICGAELAIRMKKRYKIAVWIKQADKSSTLQIGQLIKSFTNINKLEFQKHNSDKFEFTI
jgi:hypothetical protein